MSSAMRRSDSPGHYGSGTADRAPCLTYEERRYIRSIWRLLIVAEMVPARVSIEQYPTMILTHRKWSGADGIMPESM